MLFQPKKLISTVTSSMYALSISIYTFNLFCSYHANILLSAFLSSYYVCLKLFWYNRHVPTARLVFGVGLLVRTPTMLIL